MRGIWFLKIPLFIAMAVVFIVVFGYFVMSLWNWLTPTLFGWHPITYWQALGILVLCKILFGGFRGHHGGHWRSRRRMMQEWANMSPEEREKFRQSMRGRCGFGESASESKA